MPDWAKKIAFAVLGPLVAATFGSCAVALNSWHTVGQLEETVSHLKAQNVELEQDIKELRDQDRRLWWEVTDLWKGADTLSRELP
jgi:hypothetical protein